MAAAGVPMRTLQEWMGHRDYKTTSIYADYAPDPSQGARYAAKAFGSLGARHDASSDLAQVPPAQATNPRPPTANIRSHRG